MDVPQVKVMPRSNPFNPEASWCCQHEHKPNEKNLAPTVPT